MGSGDIKHLPAKRRGSHRVAVAATFPSAPGPAPQSASPVALQSPPPIASVPSLRSDLRRFTARQLEEAAFVCFEKYGFRTTTVERIVEIAGTSIPTFYRHFASKNDLLVPLRSFLTAEVAKVVARLNAIDLTRKSELRVWLDEYVVMWRRVHRLCAPFWEASDSHSEYGRTALQETRAILTGLPRFMASVPVRRRRQMQTRLSLIILSLDRLIMLAEAEADSLERDRVLDECAEIMWLSVFRPEP